MEAMFGTIETHNKWNNCLLHVKLLSRIRNEPYSIHRFLSYTQVLSLLRQNDSKALNSEQLFCASDSGSKIPHTHQPITIPAGTLPMAVRQCNRRFDATLPCQTQDKCFRSDLVKYDQHFFNVDKYFFCPIL